jgi:hypothetical protein
LLFFFSIQWRKEMRAKSSKLMLWRRSHIHRKHGLALRRASLPSQETTMKPLRIVAVCLSILVVFTSAAHAQNGKITGRVTDSQGGVLPGATVVATETSTGLHTTLATNAAGIYVFPSLPPGPYRLTVTMSGFRTLVRERLVLLTGQSLTIDVSLELAGIEETLSVMAESPMISAGESKVGGVVENVQIENVPINTRNVQELALLVPGAKPANRFDPTKGRVPAISFGTNGTGRGILYTLDGGDNTDDGVGGILQQVSMDSIQEFEVVTSRMKAEYGRAGGGVIQMVTKSGTNEFHGSVFEFFRDRSLNAKTQPEKDAEIEKGPFRRHQFGGTLGGPIIRDKAFFFVTYERVQEDVNSVLGVPPVVEALYDPDFIEEHGGFGLIDQPYRRNYLTAKYTQQFNPGNRLDFRFALERNSRQGDQVGTGFDTNVTRDFAATQTNDLWSLLGRVQTIVGDSALNELVFQASDFTNILISDLQTDFHAPGAPRLVYPSLEVGQNWISPSKTFQRKYELKDDVSYSLAVHDMKFGGTVLRVDPLGFDLPIGTSGVFLYANDGDPVNAALAFQQFTVVPPVEFPTTEYGLYFQDNWRLTESVTLNLGIRYDLEIGTLSGIEYGETGELLLNDPRSPFFGQGTPQDDKDNVAPRLGFAWDVGNRGETVFRGGWGLFYDKVIANASLFTAGDASELQGVLIFGPPFGPHNIPPFETLVEDFGFASSLDGTITPGYELPQSSQTTIGLSRQLTPTLALDLDYIHSEGIRINKWSDLNERTAPFDDTSRLFWPERTSRLRVAESIGENQYDGLLVSLRKRYSNGVQYVVNYTLSRLSGNATDFGDEAECRTCIGDERDVGPLPNDTTHRLVLSGIFLLPLDFQVSALFQAESGRPINALAVADLNGNGSFRGKDFASGPNGEPPGRGNFLGDPTYLLDLRFVKFFRFGGSKELQLMFEAFNVFNHVNWGRNFESTFESPNFGNPTGELWTNQRQIQLGVRFNF